MYTSQWYAEPRDRLGTEPQSGTEPRDCFRGSGKRFERPRGSVFANSEPRRAVRMGLSFPSLGIAYSRASVLGSCSRASGLRIPEPRCSGIGVHSTYRAQSRYTSICILCTNILVYLVYLTLALQIECAPCAQSAHLHPSA